MSALINCIEQIKYNLNEKIKTVQFHPEACPGPEDSNDIFDEFLSMI